MATTLAPPTIAPTNRDGAGAEATVPFPLLVDPSTYNPWTFDYNVQSSRCVRALSSTVRGAAHTVAPPNTLHPTYFNTCTHTQRP